MLSFLNRNPDLLPEFVSNLPESNSEVALFDADGTLWTDDVADDFTRYAIDKGLLKHGHLWDQYLKVYANEPPAGCRFALKLYKDVPHNALKEEVHLWWAKHAKRKWITEVMEALYHLHEKNYYVWVVTGTPTDLMLPIKQFIPVEKVLGIDFQVAEDGTITGEVEGISCAGAGKAEKIQSLIGDKKVAFSCGNSTMDIPMMKLAQQVIWSVYPNHEFHKEAAFRNWHITERPADFQEEAKFIDKI